MAFSIFNEAFYRQMNPDVDAAVQVGIFPSGLAHFQASGLREGRTSVSPFFNESDYRRRYPDVDAAVRSGGLVSGLQHFIISGETEGRPFNDYFLEGSYLAHNPDVDRVVRSGVLPSGLAHYLQNGRREGRSVGSFHEFFYRRDAEVGNADVDAAVRANRIFNGFEHYEKAGKFEGRIGRFDGSDGNDRVVATGTRTQLSGLLSAVQACSSGYTPWVGDPPEPVRCVDWQDRGTVQQDTLVGGQGEDTFVLTHATRLPRSDSSFYEEERIAAYDSYGNLDYAKIENFDFDRDHLLLGGTLSDFQLVPINNNAQLKLYRLAKPDSIITNLRQDDWVATIDNPTGRTVALADIARFLW